MFVPPPPPGVGVGQVALGGQFFSPHAASKKREASAAPPAIRAKTPLMLCLRSPPAGPGVGSFCSPSVSYPSTLHRYGDAAGFVFVTFSHSAIRAVSRNRCPSPFPPHPRVAARLRRFGRQRKEARLETDRSIGRTRRRARGRRRVGRPGRRPSRKREAGFGGSRGSAPARRARCSCRSLPGEWSWK